MIAVTDARAAADKLVALIRDACERVEIAGSIRRGKAEVHDAELVVIPRAGLWPLLDGLVAQGVVGKAIYSDGKHRWGEKQRGVAVDGVTVEIFTADAISWGYQLWLRTGPGPANTHVMMLRKFSKPAATWEARGGYIHDAQTGERLIVPDEATMFTILGVTYLPPHERTLELYESIFKRGHKWGDVSQIAREASTQPAAKPAPGTTKYAPYTGTVYVPKFDRGEIVQVDGQRYAVGRIVCNMRSNVVPKGQPFEYELRPMAAGERVVYAWEYQIAAYAPEAPVAVIAEPAPVAPVVESQPAPVIAEPAPVAPVVESQPVAEVAAPITPPAPLLLPSCDLRPLRDAVTEILAAHPPTDRAFKSTLKSPWAVCLGEIHWDGVRWVGQWIEWQADGVVIYESKMGKPSAEKGMPATRSNFRYYPACSFGEFCDLMADAYAVYGQKHPRHRKYMHLYVPAGNYKMPAGDVAAEAYRRWRVAQRVNRPQRVTVTPDVICLPASMTAPPMPRTFDDFVDALLADDSGRFHEGELFDLVREYGFTLADIEPHLTSSDEQYRYAAVIALGVLSSTCEFSEALRLLRAALSAPNSFLVNNALEWAMWHILPEWWAGLTRGIEALSGLCAWCAFVVNTPLEQGFTITTSKRGTSIRFEGAEVLRIDDRSIADRVQTMRRQLAVNQAQQLTLF